MKSVLLISQEPVGATMSGPGIRAYHLAVELAREFRVALMAHTDGKAVGNGARRAGEAPAPRARTGGTSEGAVARERPREGRPECEEPW